MRISTIASGNEPEDSARLLAPILDTAYVRNIVDTVRRVKWDTYDSLPNGTNRDRGMFACPLMGQSLRYALQPDWSVDLSDLRTDFLPPDSLKASFDRLIYWTGYKTKYGIRTNKKGPKSYFRIGQPMPEDEETGQTSMFEDEDLMTAIPVGNLPAKKVLAVISKVTEEKVDGAIAYMLRTWLVVPGRFLANGTLIECADEEEVDKIPLARIPIERNRRQESTNIDMPEYREKDDNTGENGTG